MRTAVIGVGHLGRQHARIHADLDREGFCEFVGVCDVDFDLAMKIGRECGTPAAYKDWRTLEDVDAVSLAVPTEQHREIAVGLLSSGIDVLVEKPIARSLWEADQMILAAKWGNATLCVGHTERFNPAMIALRPRVKGPQYFEIHRIGQFTARSLDIDVILDLMIHDIDIVQWLVGEEVVDVRAVGIPILTDQIDAANVRLEFASGAVANLTASRVGTEKIRKMRFFQPNEYVTVDYANNYVSISHLAPSSPWPGMRTEVLQVKNVEPLRAEIEAFLINKDGATGEDGRKALSVALRALEQIKEKRKCTSTMVAGSIT